MNKTEVVRQLKAWGTEQYRKMYARHGITDPVYGVSYANLRKLAKSIKTDHALAKRLWTTKNFDVRVLATMVADPTQMTVADLDTWVADVNDHALAGAFSELAYRTPAASKVAKRWRRSRDEVKSTCGWNMTGHLASHGENVDEEELEAALELIEARIHRSPNFTRYAMNNVVIAIGGRTPRLRRVATATAKRIGKVEVDHGETGCKTPDAVAKIAHKAKKQAKKKLTKKKMKTKQKTKIAR